MAHVMAEQLSRFVSKYTGAPMVGDTDPNRGECVGLVEVWIDFLKLPHVWGNAAQLLDNAPDGSYYVIFNTATNFPVAGDIVVWGTSWGGGFGHTGVIISANAMSFLAFEQNDPMGATPRLKHYTYEGVRGWLGIPVKR